jgi:biopolymer transport protein ExbB/TolQ
MNSTELQIWELIMDASLLVQGVMLLLVLASIASWMVIFRKRQVLNRAEKRCSRVRGNILVGCRPEQALRQGRR